MTERKGGLGRGLAALIPSAPVQKLGPEATEALLGGTPPADPEAPGAERDAPPVTPRGADSSTEVAPDREVDADSGGTGPGANADPERHGASEETGAPATSTGDLGQEESPAGAVFHEIPVDQVTRNPKQPRAVFDEESLAELEHSIKEFGLLQPIVVRADPGGGYQLVMGERRLRAASQAGLERIPAIVRSTSDDALLRDALLENIHRVQLNPLEEAAAYEQLLQEFAVTHDELADRIGRSRPVITNTIRLLRLPVPVQRRVAAGVLSAGHARALLSLEEAGSQEEIAARIVAEGMSVRATEEAVTMARARPAAEGEAEPSEAGSRKQQTVRSPGMESLAERLSDAFETRVQVTMGKRKGRIVVEFGSVDDLERIVAMMQPDAPPGHTE